MYLLLNLVICLHSTRKRSGEKKKGMGRSLTLVAVLRSGPAIPIHLFELKC